jgi:hypothetical protein
MVPLRERSSQAIARALAAIAMFALVPLVVRDTSPRLFPVRAHDTLAAVPLTLIAVGCSVYAIARRAPLADLAKACMLAAAFLFWAANQLWPDHPRALLFNDIAIALFVLDVFLAIIGWPASTGALNE